MSTNKEKYIVVYNDEVRGLLSQNCNIYVYRKNWEVEVFKKFQEDYKGCIMIGIITPEEQAKKLWLKH